MSGHTLPSGDHRTSFTGFFTGAKLARNGDIHVTFLLSPECRATMLEMAEGDGMALNVTVWDTVLPEGDAELAKALGLDVEGD